MVSLGAAQESAGQTHQRGRGNAPLAQGSPAQLEPEGFPLTSSQRKDLIGHRHRTDEQAIDRPTCSLVPRIRDLDHVICVLGQLGDQTGIGK